MRGFSFTCYFCKRQDVFKNKYLSISDVYKYSDNKS